MQWQIITLHILQVELYGSQGLLRTVKEVVVCYDIANNHVAKVSIDGHLAYDVSLSLAT